MDIVFNKTNFDIKHVSGDENSGRKFKHKTSIQYKLFPFTTKWNRKSFNEYVYFSGILGEVYRNYYNKEIPKSLKNSENYQSDLKNTLIKNAVDKTQINSEEERKKFEKFIGDMFFEDNSLFCFSQSTLPYLSFKNENSTLKQIGSLIYELFLSNNQEKDDSGIEKKEHNILYRLINESLPKLDNKEVKSFNYVNWNKELASMFRDDYNFLKLHKQSFLENIDFLIKHYFFIYISEVALTLDDWFEKKEHEIFYLLESESGITKNRDGYNRGWVFLEKRLTTLFSHANCLEFLNYVSINGKPSGSYLELKEVYETLELHEQKKLIEEIVKLREYYKILVTKPQTGWDKCDEDLNYNPKFKSLECPLEKEIFHFWFIIDYQFLHTQRHKPYKDYRLWFTEFVRANFLKRRGRHGYSLKLEQDKLIFFTKLCIKNEPNIRLKNLWIELSKRGFNFDETTKMEIVKLFEKINLIEKKSDSGDAQYVRTIL